MIKVDVLPIAQLEFREGFHWYRERSMRAARRFALEVKAAIATIRDDPERFPRWDDVYRFSIVSKFPYYVAYREAEDRVVIVTIRHASRDQDAWKGR
jgi:plasmid stabilization system protein ParE